MVYYIANSYLKTKRLIKEFLKRIVLILGSKQVSLLTLSLDGLNNIFIYILT